MIALLDLDIFVHRVGYTTENEDFGIARWRMDTFIEDKIAEVGADSSIGFLSDSTENGFRIQIYPQYKANRTKPKPRHYDALKEHLLTSWDAHIAVGQEADDALGINQNQDIYDGGHTTIICSIDKDLKQIPGWHYNFVKGERFYVSPDEGTKFFYTQILTGDTADNILGLVGIGPAKAKKILEDAQTEEELFTAVLCAYEERVGSQYDSVEHAHNSLLVTGQVLKIKTKEDEPLWNFPRDVYTEPSAFQEDPLRFTP